MIRIALLLALLSGCATNMTDEEKRAFAREWARSLPKTTNCVQTGSVINCTSN